MAERNLRIALVHDWLLGMRGGERCLEVICSLYPGADIFTLFYDPSQIVEGIRSRRVTASLLNRVPGSRRLYRYLLPLYPMAARKLGEDISRGGYDAVISISHCAAKNVFLPERLPHLCYCLTPVRYLWDQYDNYFGRKRYEPLIRALLPKLRAWDIAGAARVTSFVGISEFVRARIEQLYGFHAQVIFPPVRTDWISPRTESAPGEGFLCANALVPYKKTEVIIEAFNELGLPLTVVGTGPEDRYLRSIAKDNIHFVGWISDPELAELYRDSRALVFAAEEDFGMIPVEMQAAGRPVIALGKGGALETVCTEPGRETGVLFPEPTKEYMKDAVRQFLEREAEFSSERCCIQAAKFSSERFAREFQSAVAALIQEPAE